jgi:hypothetical protein
LPPVASKVNLGHQAAFQKRWSLNCTNHACSANCKLQKRFLQLRSMSDHLFEPELITGIENYEGEVCVVMKWRDHEELTWEPLAAYLGEDRVLDLIEFLGNGGDQTDIPPD